MSIKKTLMPALLLSVFVTGYALAQEELVSEEPAQEAQAAAQAAPPPAGEAADDVWDDGFASSYVPAMSYWGVRGLSQTVSAEPLGMGRITLALFGSYFKQNQDGVVNGKGEPAKGTNVGLGRLAFGWGVNDYVDVFAAIPINVTNREDETKYVFNIGEIVGGGKLTLPMPEEWIIKLALQGYLVYGLTSEKDRITITGKRYDGYDYFDTRSETIDVVAKLAASAVFGTAATAIKVHGNAGLAYTTRDRDETMLLLLAAGLQVDPVEFLTIGLEINSRTSFDPPTYEDPLWLTPSVMYRSPWNFGVLAGCDVGLSAERKYGPKALESWRVFGDIVVSLDILASKRADMERKRREDAAEKAKLAAETQRLAAEKANLAEKARQDSIAAANEMDAERAEMARRAEADSQRAQAMADSLKNINATMRDSLIQKARADSIALEQKRVADSLAHAAALAETQKKLEEEKSKRSDAEKVMLNTGMLVLDAVVFPSGKTDLPVNAKSYLSIIAKMLVKYPKLKIEIGGHTDRLGNPTTNLNLSQKRAESVYMHMVQTEPTLATMLTARGYGASLPKDPRMTGAAHEVNRRVELKVLNPEVLKEYDP